MCTGHDSSSGHPPDSQRPSGGKKEGRKEEEGKTSGEGRAGGRQGEGAEDDGRGKNREITARFTLQERKNVTASTAEQPGGDGKEMEMNQEGGEAAAAE